MVVGGYKGGMSNMPREFSAWSEAHEISYWDGNKMNTCNLSLHDFEGLFTLKVE